MFFNLFRKKPDTKTLLRANQLLCYEFLPSLVEKFNQRKIRQDVFLNKSEWSKMYPALADKSLRINWKKILCKETGFKTNPNIWDVMVIPEPVDFPAWAKVALVVIDKRLHKASLYALEPSFGANCIIGVDAPGVRTNYGMIPSGDHQYDIFIQKALELSGLNYKEDKPLASPPAKEPVARTVSRPLDKSDIDCPPPPPLSPFRYMFTWDDTTPNGNIIKGTLKTRKYGTLLIELPKTVVQGHVVAQFPQYNFTMRMYITGMSDVNEMVVDMQDIMKAYEETGSRPATISKVVGDHIKRHGRIIDSDMNTYISYLTLILKAIHVKKGHLGLPVTTAYETLEKCVRRIEKDYPRALVMTGMRQTPAGMQPYPINYITFLEQRGLQELPIIKHSLTKHP